MRYLSVCSGIEAASVSWHDLGWEPLWFSEIEPFQSAVLAHRFPNVPNRGDMSCFKWWPDANVDVLVGGTPCQSFSVAGLRKGLADPRGDLMLTYLAIAARYRPQWLVWENVPGVLSSNGGQDFACLLRGLAELGYGWAYRVLDAQYFGVAQRRRRVFVVGHLGDWHPAAAVLFERDSLRRDSAPSREARQSVATGPAAGAGSGGWPHEIAGTLDAHYGDKRGLEDQHIFNQRASRFVQSQPVAHAFKVRQGCDGGGKGYLGQDELAFNARQDPDSWYGRTGPLDTDGSTQPVALDYEFNAHGIDTATGPLLKGSPSGGGHPLPAVALPINTQIAMRHNALGERTGFGVGEAGDPAFTLTKGHSHAVQTAMQVRRLTPVECERLMGFSDGYTAIPWRGKPADQCPDGPRYKALGNSMAVPVMRWIGQRIQMVNEVVK